jgi:serine protease Do
MLRRIAISAAIGTALLSAPVCRAQTERPAVASAAVTLKDDPLHVFSQSVQELSEKVTRSVVQILTTGYGLSAKDQSTETSYLEPQKGIGAGVILSPDGYIVTNAHVVEGARRIRVRLQGLEKAGITAAEPSGAVDAKLVGVDHQSDLAVIKIDKKDLPALEFTDSDHLKQGQVVFAFGSPLGLENSVSMGVVSGTARQIDPDNPAIYIQTDAPINPGNSGGPLVDVDGHMVGINTFILSESGGNEGLGFATPSNVVRNVYEQLRTEGHVHRGQIGVFVRSISPDLLEGLHLPTSHGVLLEDVSPDSPADRAGLKIGDIVQSVGGKPADNVREFALALSQYKVGETLPISILRDGQEKMLEVQVAERPDDPLRFADMVSGPDNLVPRLGIVGISLNKQIRQMLPDLRIPGGVVVAAKTPASALLGEGPQPGDIIHAVNGATIEDVTELRQKLRDIKPGVPVVLQIEREGSLSYLILESE